jgi:integrase
VQVKILAVGRMIKVSVRENRGTLQLGWVYPTGQRRYLGTGLSDTKGHRAISGFKAREIEQDIFTGQYDESLAKYRSKPPKTAAMQPVPSNAEMTFGELWAKFTIERSISLSPTTIHGDYHNHGRMIDRCPHQLTEPQRIRSWALDNYSHDHARRWLVALNAMGKWAVQCRILAENPFQEYLIAKKKSDRPKEIDPFSPIERDLIIEAFKVNEYYFWYWRLVQFLSYTGARPSEAIALEWSTIKADHLVLCQGATKGEGGAIRIKAGLKTQQQRKLPLSPKISEAIGDRHQNHNGDFASSSLVFPSPTGGLITWPNFTRRAWRSVLGEIDNVPKKNPYQLRAGYITAALDSGMSVQDVARLVGNSPEVIYKNYAGVSRDIRQPEI